MFNKFKGFIYAFVKKQLHAPLGDANLTIINNSLVVNNIGSTCLDGVMVDTQDFSNWEMVMEPITLDTYKELNMTLFGRDGYNRIKALQQLAVFFNSDLNQTQFCFNSRLTSSVFELVGKIGDTVTFDKLYTNPVLPPYTNWLGVVIGVGIYILNHFDYKKRVKRDSHGKVKETEEVFSWNSIKPNGDPNPKQFTTFDNENFQADNIYLNNIFDYSSDPRPSILENKACMVQLTGKDISSFTINDYILS